MHNWLFWCLIVANIMVFFNEGIQKDAFFRCVAGMGFEPCYIWIILTDERSSLGERTEAPPVADEARQASGSGRNFVSECERKISGTATGQANAKRLWEEPGEFVSRRDRRLCACGGQWKIPSPQPNPRGLVLGDYFFTLHSSLFTKTSGIWK